jgi:hypothetical protein
MDSAARKAQQLGREGWEMVACTVQPYDEKAMSYGDGRTGGANIYNLHLRGEGWFATGLLKRPIAPQQ